MSSKSSSGQKGHRPGGRTRDLDNEDAIAILKAVVDFRSKNGGSPPTRATMKPVLDAVKGSLHREVITVDQLYNKFRHLKHQYYKAVNAGVGPTPFDSTFYELSVKAWGAKRTSHFEDDDAAGEIDEGSKKKKSSKKMKIEDNPSHSNDDEAAGEIDDGSKQKKSSKKMKFEDNPSHLDDDEAAGEIGESSKQPATEEEEEEEDEEDEEENGGFGNYFNHLTDQARKHWEMTGMPISSLELGLKFIDKTKAAALESKWMQHFKVEINIMAKSCDAKKDLCLALVAAAQKGASS